MMAPAHPPLDRAWFECAMARFGPFEPAPRLALAVSGGADSMALAWLAMAWLRERGGQGIALIVDHGLRPEASEEAATVAGRCRALGLEAQVLRHGGPAPESAVEASARALRYRLLEEACLSLGCLHLLVAHHADDQAETIAMRADRASGQVGLAGMSACLERAGYRLLRPLLDVPKASLVATTRSAGLPWVEDPMNRDPRFARARLRRHGIGALPPPAAPDRLALEQRLSAALPGLVALDGFGIARMDRLAWRQLAGDLRAPALARIAMTVGAGRYGPASAALETLGQRLDGEVPASATLGGCLWRAGRAHVTVSREVRNLPGTLALAPRVPMIWDGRFLVEGEGKGLCVQPLAALGRADLALLAPLARARGLTASASAALPAILDLEGLAAVPHLGYARSVRIPPVSVIFRPRHALSPVPFVAPGVLAAGGEQGHGALMLA